MSIGAIFAGVILGRRDKAADQRHSRRSLFTERMSLFLAGQLLAVGSLAVYLLYLVYYYTVPMCCFKLILYRAIRRKLCLGLETGDGKITVRYLKDGREQRYTKRIDEEVPNRFASFAACRTLRSILSDIEKGAV